MSVSISIPTPLRTYTDNKDQVDVDAATVGEAIGQLVAEHADLKPHLYTEDGKLRTFVNIFLNDEDVRFLDKQNTPVKAGDHLSIIPSIAGGSGRTAR